MRRLKEFIIQIMICVIKRGYLLMEVKNIGSFKLIYSIERVAADREHALNVAAELHVLRKIELWI